jgi:hypothetical protein
MPGLCVSKQFFQDGGDEENRTPVQIRPSPDRYSLGCHNTLGFVTAVLFRGAIALDFILPAVI